MPEYDISQITVSSGGSSVTANLHDSQIPDVNEAIEAILDGGGSEPVLVTKTITQNGTYTASSDNADGYSSVVANIPNTYTAQDDGKVVSGGSLIAQTSGSTTQNGTVDTTTISSLSVAVEPDLTTKSISANGTYNASSDSADGYSSVTVAVPETFAFLFVTTNTGATITVSNGTTTLPSQTSTGDELLFHIPESGTWTVTAEKTGEATKTETVSITTTDAYTLNMPLHHIYGVSWDKSSSTALTRTDDAVGFSDPNPYYSSMSGTPSSPFDNLMPWSGMTKETIDGNVLVKIPKFWYKITNTSNKLKIQIADNSVEGFSVSPAHQARNVNETDRDYVYIGRYKCDSSYKSTSSSSPKVNITRATARSGITSLGTGYYIQDFAMFWTIRMLYLVEFADWNSQIKIGYGCGNNSSIQSTGYTDNKTYHTGTTQSSRTTYGLGTQYRWIEGLWDNVYEWVDGIRFSSSAIYIYTDPSTYSDSSGGTNIGSRASSFGYIKGWLVPSGTLDWALYPNSVGGSDSTYVPDYCDCDSSGVVLYVGGTYGRSVTNGFFCLKGNSSASYSYNRIGVRLEYLP